MGAKRKTPAFLDTSAIYAIADADDAGHCRCLEIYRRTPRFLCHGAVLLESFSLLCKRIHKQAAVTVMSAIRTSPRIEVVHVDPPLLAAGWERAVRFDDKEWDWVDCISFELMERRGLVWAHTMDHHFRQAGFRIM